MPKPSVIRKLDENPSVSVFYVFCGETPKDEHTNAIKRIVIENLSRCPDCLSGIKVSIVDGNELKKMCKELVNDYSAELNIRDIIPLTVNSNERIKKAYAFTCDAKELLKLLCKEDNTIRRSLFNDNVRDYLGNRGGVNSEIEKTIEYEPEMFLMCNNGITIVCSDFLQIRDKLVSIDNPQIVNGCQTCNSIFSQRESPSLDKVQLLIKLICTEDVLITNKVVRGTNKQNQVLEESFETTKPFHQNLEEYFNAKTNNVTLYYERRNKQYSSIPTINKLQIVNLRVLTQTFVSMFLHSPHLAHRHEAKLLLEFAKEGNRRIYADSHSFEPYYICALTWYKFDDAFRRNVLPENAKTYKAHLYYIFTFVTGQYPCENVDKNSGINKFCVKLENILISDNFDEYAVKVYKAFCQCEEEWRNQGESIYAVKDTRKFTNLLETLARRIFVNKTIKLSEKEQLPSSQKEKWTEGKILTVKIKNGKWFAFIKISKNIGNVYFDSRAYQGDFKELAPNVKVRVKYLSKNRNREVSLFAKEVEIIKEPILRRNSQS